LAKRTDITDEERSRLDRLLKAWQTRRHSASWEMVQHELPEGKTQKVHRIR
jgi:hypothetical protein